MQPAVFQRQSGQGGKLASTFLLAATAQGGENNGEGNGAGKQGGGAAATTPLEDAERRLRELGADVEVEALPELDVIILRGRDRDVAEMARIIEEIERLSAETEPSIYVYPLRHVRGESLASIVEAINAELLTGRQGASASPRWSNRTRSC